MPIQLEPVPDDKYEQLRAELEHHKLEAKTWRSIAYALASRIRELASISDRAVVLGTDEARTQLKTSIDRR